MDFFAVSRISHGPLVVFYIFDSAQSTREVEFVGIGGT